MNETNLEEDAFLRLVTLDDVASLLTSTDLAVDDENRYIPDQNKTECNSHLRTGRSEEKDSFRPLSCRLLFFTLSQPTSVISLQYKTLDSMINTW